MSEQSDLIERYMQAKNLPDMVRQFSETVIPQYASAFGVDPARFAKVFIEAFDELEFMDAVRPLIAQIYPVSVLWKAVEYAESTEGIEARKLGVILEREIAPVFLKLAEKAIQKAANK